MRGFVLSNFTFVLQRKADVVKALEQTVTREFVNLKTGGETVIVSHRAFLEIDSQLIIRDC
jgi:hypothetical protein